jgi:uncharacterized protein YndB with AHSA1/START domain
MPNDSQSAPVKKSITVRASVPQAFEIFTADFDSWWPRSHHIGSSPMQKAIIETHLRGRCYSEQIDGTECDWGQVLAWEPPHRLVIAWQIGGDWKYEPDLAKSSEVEILFTEEPDGRTLVSLEHRHLDRTATHAEAMRASLESPNGWGGMLQLFAERVSNGAGTTSNNHSTRT